MVHLLRSSGRADVSWFCGHPDVNGDLEVILLLTDEGLVGGGVDETFVCVDMVGRRRPGEGETFMVDLLLEPTRFSWVLHSQCLKAAAEEAAPPIWFEMFPRQMLV